MAEHLPGMIFERDVGIAMSDGVVLRANVFRPDREGRFPVVMSMGLYGKDVHFRDAFSSQWERLLAIYPGLIGEGSSGRFLRWELPDPERWVPDGYAVVAVDSRGSGKSPGFLDAYSAVETRDYAEAIEWAGGQAWSNGRVGLLGVSYLASKQWQVAALQPEHLAAIAPWEGCCDFYREWSRHGGIRTTFPVAWWPRQVIPNQHGNADSPYRDPDTGERTTGPTACSPEILAGSRSRFPDEILNHPLDDEWYAEMTPDFARIRVPVLSAANWGGPGLHLRGNIEGWRAAGSAEKWLSFHIGTHFESFYLPEYVEMQKRFFARYLKGEDNGWETRPPVRLAVRGPDGATVREEFEWPLARTHWRKHYLDPAAHLLTETEPAVGEAAFDALGDGLHFATAPFAAETEFTGPVAARLFVSSSTTDLDIFATLRLIDPAGEEVSFVGAHEDTPVTRGWLRASHRKTDPARSEPWRPWHSHDEIQKLAPGEVVALDVEIWPTSIVCPPGYRLVLTIMGRDFEYDVPGRMLHDDPADRPMPEFGGRTTIHAGGDRASYLLLPHIPA